jgi:ketosteroid isomerase-like protein
MSRTTNYIATLLLLTASCLSAQTAPRAINLSSGDATSDISVSQIKDLLQRYATSIDQADITLASDIWSHDSEVSFIHPLGTEIGYDNITSNVYQHLMGGYFSKRQLLIHNSSIHVYGDTAWSEFTWTFHATHRSDGAAVTTEGRETQIYRKEHGTWRIVHVHYSGPPAQAPAQAQAPEPKDGYVPDEKAAVKIAEATLVHRYKYRAKDVQSYQPFHATLHDGVWTVHSTLPRGTTGGRFGMDISQRSGAVLRFVEFQ